MKLFKTFFLLLVFFSLGFCWPKPVGAAQFDLLAPNENLTMGQNVLFTVTIDTQSRTLTSIQVGLTYDTKYLQFIDVTPGNTFSTITYTTPDTGKVLLTASHSTGVTGTGTFAYVKFKIIAAAPGATELCVLYNPATPTTQPATQPTTPPVQTTSAPNPTALPKSGETKIANSFLILGSIFLLITFSGFYLTRKNYF